MQKPKRRVTNLARQYSIAFEIGRRVRRFEQTRGRFWHLRIPKNHIAFAPAGQNIFLINPRWPNIVIINPRF
jgi:hypothetical protein